MPWVFLVLLLANVAFFGWELLKEADGRDFAAAQVVVPQERQLELLSERPDVIRAVEKTEQAPPSVAEAAVLQCFSVGAYESKVDAQRFEGRMRGQGVLARLDEIKKDSLDYWVFLPAFVNRTKAEERLRELRQQGVDSFIVNDAPFANAISLGHFSRKELADDFLGKMQAAGIAAELRALSRSAEERWVYIAPGNAKGDIKEMIDKALPVSGSVRRLPAPCEG